MSRFRIEHTLTASATGLLLLLSAHGAWAATPEDTTARCDTLASDPRDPGRFAAGVTNEQFAPGAAIEACKAAVSGNPALARSWFQLGRAYWIAERDTDAFAAFVQAANRGYAPAMKYIGDAYNEGRGLPSSESQSIDIALAWYKKARDAGFRAADAAIQEASATLASATFNPSLFQNPSFASRIYSGNFESIDNPILFFAYVKAFADELGGSNVFFIDQSCKGMVTQLGTTVLGIQGIFSYLQGLQGENGLAKVLVSAVVSSFSQDQGERDAVILMDNYKCKSPIARRVVDNIIGSYQKLPTIINASLGSSRDDIEKKRTEDARAAIAFSGSMRFPLESRDVGEVCSSETASAACKGAWTELRSGTYGSLRCGYYNKSTNKTWNYFFWDKAIPYNLVSLAKGNQRAATRVLGTIPVQGCPKAQDEAEALYKQNNQ